MNKVPGQVLIVPQEHVMAMTDADEAVWADVRNYQKCLISFYESLRDIWKQSLIVFLL